MGSILIVAGENSGDKYGASLVNQFKKLNHSFTFFGIAGNNMLSAGVEQIASIEELSIIGFTRVMSNLPKIKKLFNHIESEVVQRKPAASILIDSPDFNLRLAKKLKKLSIPVLYYISPTVWAWRKGRVKTIKKFVDKMMLIFPFEKEIYKSSKIPHTYVGHPLKEIVKISLKKKDFFNKYGFTQKKKFITLLPGSRKSELKFHMPILIKTIHEIKKKIPSQFALILAENLDKRIIQEYIPDSSIEIKIITKDKYDAINWSDLALSSYGTANLETALLETPLITFYRCSPVNFFIIKTYGRLTFAKIRNFSIVNILAGEKIIPEFLQKNFTPNNIFKETKRLLESEEIKTNMITNFRKIKEALGEKKASQNAALELEKLILNTREQ